MLSSKLKESEKEVGSLKDRLTQEERLKDEYHMSFKRTQFDLDKLQTRHASEKESITQKLHKTED